MILEFLATAASVTGTLGNHEQVWGTLTPKSFVFSTTVGVSCRADGEVRFYDGRGASGLLSCDDGRGGDFTVFVGQTDGSGIGHVAKEWLVFSVSGFHTCPAFQNPLDPDPDCVRWLPCPAIQNPLNPDPHCHRL